jgi:hypothetical protein
MTDTKSRVIAALNTSSSVSYEVRDLGGGIFSATAGSLAMNVLCGCCAQYYEYTIDCSAPEQITYRSEVCCGGFLGGVIGMAMNDAENNRVGEALRKQFPGATVFKI